MSPLSIYCGVISVRATYCRVLQNHPASHPLSLSHLLQSRMLFYKQQKGGPFLTQNRASPVIARRNNRAARDEKLRERLMLGEVPHYPLCLHAAKISINQYNVCFDLRPANVALIPREASRRQVCKNRATQCKYAIHYHYAKFTFTSDR